MRALVIHTWLGQMGGAESVALNIACALSEHGYEVEMVSVETPPGVSTETISTVTRKELALMCPEVASSVKILKSAVPFSVKPPFTAYKRLLCSLILTLKAINGRGPYDVVIVTSNHLECLGLSFFGNLTPDVMYVHFPEMGYKYLSSGVLSRTYYFLGYLLESMCYTRPRLLIANSNHTAKWIKWLYGREPVVLYPPVNVEFYESFFLPPDARLPRVVTVGRLEPSKNHHMLKRLARMFPHLEFVSIGRKVPGHEHYLGELLTGSPPNYKIYVGVDRYELARLLCSSSLYVHLMPYEHFGIAPLEAVACGVPALVHKGSGAAELLPEPLQWTSVDDIYNTISNLSQFLSEWIKLYPSVRSRLKELAPAKFRKKFVEEVLG